MGHKTLSDKLDQIQKEDLGIHFNESLLWEDLSAKLGNKKTVLVERRLLMAACITLLILLFPVVFRIDSKLSPLADQIQSAPEIVNSAADLNPKIVTTEEIESTKKTPVYLVQKKGVEVSAVAVIDFSKVEMNPIPIVVDEKIERQLFAIQDISIIRASLGTPSIEKEKSVTVRAQLHTSSQPVQLNNQAFKIKLFEVSNQ